jgi:hypothetical protein
VKPRPKPATITPKKETPVPEKMTMESKVLGIITRRGATGKSPILQGSKASSEELKGIIAELARVGKIKVWEYRGRAGMMALYTLPDAKDPRTKEMIEGKPVASAKPATPRVARATAPVAKPAPSNGGSPFASAIADLEARRSAALADVKKYDAAIETLRALA